MLIQIFVIALCILLLSIFSCSIINNLESNANLKKSFFLILFSGMAISLALLLVPFLYEKFHLPQFLVIYGIYIIFGMTFLMSVGILFFGIRRKKWQHLSTAILGGISLTALSNFIGESCGLVEPGGVANGWKGLPFPIYECGVWGERTELLFIILNIFVWSALVYGFFYKFDHKKIT